MADFPRAIKRLWQLGLFKNIQIHYDSEDESELDLVIKVEENYILGEIQFRGNKKIKKRKFEDEIEITKGQRIQPNSLTELSNKIKDIYSEKGYLNVSIMPSLVPPSEDLASESVKGKDLIRDVMFTIEENNKIKIKNIIFDGNNSFSDFRLRWEMKETKRQPWYLFWRSTFDKEKFEEDKNLISTFIETKVLEIFTLQKIPSFI